MPLQVSSPVHRSRADPAGRPLPPGPPLPSGPGVCNLNLDLSWFFIKQTFNCTEEYLDVMGSRLCGDLTGKEGT